MARPPRLRASRFGAPRASTFAWVATVAHTHVGKRERRLARPAGLEPAATGLEGRFYVRQTSVKSNDEKSLRRS
jgi:hypothetical protein